jgi:hypothetical protein
MPAWTGSPAGANYRGFTHRSRRYRGFTHQSESTDELRLAQAGANKRASLWITRSESRFLCRGSRGFTHLSVGGSPTALSGDHPPNHGVSPTNPLSENRRNPRVFDPFLRLNLLNDSSLTESLNVTDNVTEPPQSDQKSNGIGPAGPMHFRCVTANAVTRAAYGRRLPKKPRRSGGVYSHRRGGGKGGEIPQNSLPLRGKASPKKTYCAAASPACARAGQRRGKLAASSTQLASRPPTRLFAAPSLLS